MKGEGVTPLELGRFFYHYFSPAELTWENQPKEFADHAYLLALRVTE